ncbi:hypothetical protein MTO96_019234 [Rhipicephalus appendiculatus]
MLSRCEVNNFLYSLPAPQESFSDQEEDIDLNGAMAQPLMRALQVTAAGRDLGELHLRTHPTNNTFTVATSHETTALHLVQLKELVLQTATYPVTAYIAPPPAAVRGVISQFYWEGTSELDATGPPDPQPRC